tara:strand:+ start:1100 stop:3646 length:2547 start_codon:yes stop_codon:yes gene_type:complete
MNNQISSVKPLSGLYKDWFLDYASYVILERAIPNIYDGMKPVQRRILHSLKELHDGRYHKVANVIGNTMKYHPHGDTSIGESIIQIGQKDLLLDKQGNWGNIATGDKAAAPRYIEVRLTDFALHTVFNRSITSWVKSYDGRSNEPEILPVKFPLLLNHGVEGIAVGLSTKILPHNFNELLDASIKIIKGKSVKIYPDFNSGGFADFSQYNDGKRGGRVRVRAKLEKYDKNSIVVSELPYSVNSGSLINSILKANDKGKIKIKKVDDNTAENVEILITLPSGISIEKTIDALYRFSDCEISLSPISCVIKDNKPVFLGVSEILKISTENTKSLLLKELDHKLSENEKKWHKLSLERIFIENRLYRNIEEIEDWDKIIATIYISLKPFIKKLNREIDDDDILRLTEIKIKRITKFDINKAKNEIKNIESVIEEIKFNIKNIDSFCVDYFKNLKKRFGIYRKRKTIIKTFENIDAVKVVASNKKLYINRSEGFIGTNMRKDEFISDCSDIDDIITIRKNGVLKIVKIDKKVFVGKDIIYCSVFKKNDDRTIYNMIYKDSQSVNTYIKRFAVKSITRNKDYKLCKNLINDKILYLTVNPNGEAEKVNIHLRALKNVKNVKLEIDFSRISIKGRSSIGNIVTKKSVKRVDLKESGISTLQARKIWFDNSVFRLNVDERGEFIGEFSSDDKIVTINQKGEIEFKSYDLSNHFKDDLIFIEKYKADKVISIIYYDGGKKLFYVKRFKAELVSKPTMLFNNTKDSYLENLSTLKKPIAKLSFKKEVGKEREHARIDLSDFIAVKGQNAKGKIISKKKIIDIEIFDFNDNNNKSVSDNFNDNSTFNDNNNHQITLDL